ncbi:MAG TPA: DUF2312 domain-containing protein [Stellaceae bacterium]|nr:DUF2312 domain-containing protein [Stellaceae bacterium]
MTVVGQNTVSGQLLAAFVERIESVRAEKKQLGETESAIFAEAKAAGFATEAIRTVVKLRAMKPHARQEAEALRDQYLHALGMLPELPLFRQVGLINVDIKTRESVIEALKAFVPEKGSITIEAGGKPVRLTRDKGGEVSVSEVVEMPVPAAATPATAPRREKPPVPDVDEAGAEALGRGAFKENAPVISNPFPFGDPRRARWDEGWRKESGTDGMGPERKP